MERILICVALMALVTYLPRVLPVTLFRRPIRSRFIRSFLDYTPYAVLGALTFRRGISIRLWAGRWRRSGWDTAGKACWR